MADLRSNQERMAAWGAGAAPATTTPTTPTTGWEPNLQNTKPASEQKFNSLGQRDYNQDKANSNAFLKPPQAAPKPMLQRPNNINSMGMNTDPHPGVEQYQNNRDAGMMRQPDLDIYQAKNTGKLSPRNTENRVDSRTSAQILYGPTGVPQAPTAQAAAPQQTEEGIYGRQSFLSTPDADKRFAQSVQDNSNTMIGNVKANAYAATTPIKKSIGLGVTGIRKLGGGLNRLGIRSGILNDGSYVQ